MSTDLAPSPNWPVPVEPDLSPNAVTVLEHRYLMRDDDGRVTETPSELFHRVTKAIAEPEAMWGTSPQEQQRLEHKFYQLMATRRFLPNSPTLMNAGRRLGITLYHDLGCDYLHLPADRHRNNAFSPQLIHFKLNPMQP